MELGAAHGFGHSQDPETVDCSKLLLCRQRSGGRTETKETETGRMMIIEKKKKTLLTH